VTIGRTQSIALAGLSGHLVDIEADIASGLPALILIGLPDTSLGESKDRVRSAIANSGCEMPPTRVTVNLSPASLPKQGSGFDLAIALAIVAGSGIVAPESVASCVHLGELALDGRVRPVSGILPAVLAARDAGVERIMVPAGNRAEAELVPGVTVVPIASLAHALRHHGADIAVPDVTVIEPPTEVETEPPHRDLADIVGQPDVVDALVTAAAGGHHLFLLGPPGAGKTMLAERLVDILPDLTPEESLEVTSIASLARVAHTSRLETRPPFVAPHHTATAVAIVGGGSGIIRPGAVSRASRGVLFLDEAPEFATTVLDSLRQPLESGDITIHRAQHSARFPARVQLVIAANPCPCGNAGVADATCVCTPDRRRRYLSRLSGPILDRIDIRVPVSRVLRAQMFDTESPRVTTEQARAIVVRARAMASERWGKIRPDATELRSGRFRLAPPNVRALDAALDRGALTMRGYDRVLRIAWTLADCDGSESPTADHIGRALYLRQGVPA
jgi:magnesium chelatase family protein